MKKELITVDNVNNYISKQDGKLYVFGNRRSLPVQKTNSAAVA